MLCLRWSSKNCNFLIFKKDLTYWKTRPVERATWIFGDAEEIGSDPGGILWAHAKISQRRTLRTNFWRWTWSGTRYRVPRLALLSRDLKTPAVTKKKIIINLHPIRFLFFFNFFYIYIFYFCQLSCLLCLVAAHKMAHRLFRFGRLHATRAVFWSS